MSKAQPMMRVHFVLAMVASAAFVCALVYIMRRELPPDDMGTGVRVVHMMAAMGIYLACIITLVCHAVFTKLGRGQGKSETPTQEEPPKAEKGVAK